MSDDRRRMSDFESPSAVIRRLSSVIRQLLLEPERVAAVLIVVMVPAERMIPGPAIHLNGTAISFVNFKPQGSALAPHRDFLCRCEQGRCDPAAGILRGDCERIEACHPAV